MDFASIRLCVKELTVVRDVVAEGDDLRLVLTIKTNDASES